MSTTKHETFVDITEMSVKTSVIEARGYISAPATLELITPKSQEGTAGGGFGCIRLSAEMMKTGVRAGLHVALTPDGLRFLAQQMIEVAGELDANALREAGELLDRVKGGAR